jgi:hypothetical protein
MQKIPVYIGALFDGVGTDVPALFPNFGVRSRQQDLFFDAPAHYLTEAIFDIVDNPAQARFLLIPYNYFNAVRTAGYIERFIALSEQYGKKIIVFVQSDFHDPISIPHAIVFRTSIYKREKKEHEYVIPPMVEDLSRTYTAPIRTKSTKPIIGFCGWAGFSSQKDRLKFYIKNMGNNLEQLARWDSTRAVYKKGIYFRQKALAALRRSPRVQTNFIIRTSFSGHVDTIAQDPQVARLEYVQNMLNADFVLAPKGDGNYSLRFYEALSLGRIPILIDTDSVLPIEDELAYDDFILRVRYRDINRLGNIVADFYNRLSPDEFARMQERARAAFAEHLRADAFMPHIAAILEREYQL